MKKIIVTAISFVFAMTTGALASTWKIDSDHSSANFAIQHMAISQVKGSFDKISGKITSVRLSLKQFQLVTRFGINRLAISFCN